jgi:hypothetical protein
MTQSSNQSNDYGHPKTTARHKIQRKAGNRFSFGSTIKFSFRTKPKEKLGHIRSMFHDLTKLGLNFKFGSTVC